MTTNRVTERVRDCGPLVFFAREHPNCILPLRQMRDAWAELDDIFFAFMHMFETKVPDVCIRVCRAVWRNFYNADKKIDEFADRTLKSFAQYNKMSLAHRSLLFTGVKVFLASRVYDQLAKPLRTAEEAAQGIPCNEIACMCSLFGNCRLKLEQTTMDHVDELWTIRCKLYAETNKRTLDNTVSKPRVSKKKCFPEFSDSEDEDDGNEWKDSQDVKPTTTVPTTVPTTTTTTTTIEPTELSESQSDTQPFSFDQFPPTQPPPPLESIFNLN